MPRREKYDVRGNKTARQFNKYQTQRQNKNALYLDKAAAAMNIPSAPKAASGPVELEYQAPGSLLPLHNMPTTPCFWHVGGINVSGHKFSLIVIALMLATATASDTFNPLDNMVVLRDGETKIAIFPQGPICCSIRAISKNRIEFYEYDRGMDSTSLHVTTVGSAVQLTYEEGRKGIDTTVHRELNRPTSYRPYAFEVRGEHRSNDICEKIQSPLTQEAYRDKYNAKQDEEYVANIKERNTRFFSRMGNTTEAAFTFFGDNEKGSKTAVMKCWKPEEEVFIGAQI